MVLNESEITKLCKEVMSEAYDTESYERTSGANGQLSNARMRSVQSETLKSRIFCVTSTRCSGGSLLSVSTLIRDSAPGPMALG